MRVYIVGPDNLLAEMWRDHGHEIVHKIGMADVVQFIGGADINPELYGERMLRGTSISLAADT